MAPKILAILDYLQVIDLKELIRPEKHEEPIMSARQSN